MNDNDWGLSNDFRALAHADQSEAPPELRDRLLIEFRRRSAHKRRLRWIPATGIAAAAAAILLFIAIPKQPTVVSDSPAQFAATPSDDLDSDFYPLPEADGLPPLENATVVRVQMPVTSLQLMGVAVNDPDSADSVQADILLGQDGLARGVRLVQ